MDNNIKKGLKEIVELVEKELESLNNDSWVDWYDYFHNDQYKAHVEARWEAQAKQNENIIKAVEYLKSLL